MEGRELEGGDVNGVAPRNFLTCMLYSFGMRYAFRTQIGYNVGHLSCTSSHRAEFEALRKTVHVSCFCLQFPYKF